MSIKKWCYACDTWLYIGDQSEREANPAGTGQEATFLQPSQKVMHKRDQLDNEAVHKEEYEKEQEVKDKMGYMKQN